MSGHEHNVIIFDQDLEKLPVSVPRVAEFSVSSQLDRDADPLVRCRCDLCGWLMQGSFSTPS